MLKMTSILDLDWNIQNAMGKLSSKLRKNENNTDISPNQNYIK